MLRSASIMKARHDEIVDRPIKEAGRRARGRVGVGWFIRSCSRRRLFPHRFEGKIFPLDELGKESRAYRQPLGVIGVISPWNFPMQLSHRPVGAALALDNAAVVKPAEDTPITGGLLIAKIYEEAGPPPKWPRNLCSRIVFSISCGWSPRRRQIWRAADLVFLRT